MKVLINTVIQKKPGAKIVSGLLPGLMPRLNRQIGVGMIEVLVALLISAFALLGLAGLQVVSLKYQKVAQFRSLASQASADMAERIRANAQGAKDGHYATTHDYLINPSPNKTCTERAKPCTPSEIAAVDLFNWRTDLSRSISGGWGDVTGNAMSGLILTVYFYEPNKKNEASGGGVKDPNCTAKISDDKNPTTIRCFKTEIVP